MTKQTVRTAIPKERILLGLGLGLAGGYTLAMLGWVAQQLSRADPRRTLAEHQNQAPKGLLYCYARENSSFQVEHSLEDGIERSVYRPKERRFETPVLMVHGMWHGAWTWQFWQELLARWGWESIAISLPGHGNSPVQRPIRRCTLDYYLGFVKAEVDRLERKPVLMGHSMGGALTQWYLKWAGDDLPAAVLVAPWVSHSALADAFLMFWRLDPVGCLQMFFSWSATPLVRSPQAAAQKLITPGALYTPEELHARLGPESGLVTFQHNPPWWRPPEKVRTPMLWIAGEKDAVVTEAGQSRSAAYYQADYAIIKDAGHNVMMERSYHETAEMIHHWLIQTGVP